jgi:hypothetical protein
MPHYHLLWCAFSLPILTLDVKIYGQWFTRGRKFLSMVANPASHITVIGNLVKARAVASKIHGCSNDLVLVSWLSCMISPQHYQASLQRVTHKISPGSHKHMTANQHTSSQRPLLLLHLSQMVLAHDVFDKMHVCLYVIYKPHKSAFTVAQIGRVCGTQRGEHGRVHSTSAQLMPQWWQRHPQTKQTISPQLSSCRSGGTPSLNQTNHHESLAARFTSCATKINRLSYRSVFSRFQYK